MTNRCMFKAKMPNIDQLCHAVVQVDESKQQFHNQTLRATKALNYVIERCAMYTIKFELTPMWAQVGQVLINNPDFITCQGKMQAINMEIRVSGDEMNFHLTPYLVKLPPTHLENFGICSEALEKFGMDSNFEINECFINLSWCHVLPSMKRGQIVTITRKLPTNHSGFVFQDYEAVRKYWKNQTFMANMQQKIGKICGISLHPEPHVFITSNQLTSSKQITGTPSHNIHEDKSQVVPRSLLSKHSNREESAVQCVPSSSDVILPTQSTVTKNPKDKHVATNQTLLSKYPLSSSGKYIPIFNKPSTSKQTEHGEPETVESKDKRSFNFTCADSKNIEKTGKRKNKDVDERQGRKKLIGQQSVGSASKFDNLFASGSKLAARKTNFDEVFLSARADTRAPGSSKAFVCIFSSSRSSK